MSYFVPFGPSEYFSDEEYLNWLKWRKNLILNLFAANQTSPIICNHSPHLHFPFYPYAPPPPPPCMKVEYEMKIKIGKSLEKFSN